MIKKADNEAYQTYELVESLKNVIYEPMKDKVKDFAKKIEYFNDSFDTHCKKLKHGKEKLISIDANYNHYSNQLSDVLRKIEYNCKDRKANFYDEKQFYSLNSKMKTVDIRAKELDSQTRELNELISNYKKEMDTQVKGIQDMEDERVQ